MISNCFKNEPIFACSSNVGNIKFCFNSAINNGQVITKVKGFFDYFDEFTTENGRVKNWTIRTYEKFSSVRKHLSEFNSKLSFSFLDEKGLTLYVEFLRDKLNMRNSTIEKQVSFLKWFLKWAKAKGYNDNLSYEAFYPKFKATQKKIKYINTYLYINKINILWIFLRDKIF